MKSFMERWTEILMKQGFAVYFSLEGDEFFEKDGIILKYPKEKDVYRLDAYYNNKKIVSATPYQFNVNIYQIALDTHALAWKTLFKNHEGFRIDKNP